MVESVVALVLKQLSFLLHQEYAHLRGLRQGLQFINDELGTIRAFLRDVESEHEQNSEFQEWVKQVREAAYDIEDVVDEFILVFACHHQNTFKAITTLRARHRISSKINDIKCRVENISARHQRYRLEFGLHGTESTVNDGDNTVHHIRQRALLLEEDDLVGIHVPKDELMSQILDDNTPLKVVSVVGMGGSGKTTLVRRVFEDAKVKRQFHSHAWITISQTFKIEFILRDLIQQLYAEIKKKVPQEVESKDVHSLKLYLKDFLRERRYIIIVDDVWRIDAWEAFEYALPDCNQGSRVMLTTRIADVASASCIQHSGYIYRMKALSNEESWSLFCKRSFEDNSCPQHLENVSRRILKKCEGLPLAIVSVSGLLFLKNKRPQEWEKVHRSLGGELEGTGKLDRVKKILLLSYNDLPYYLKSCLLYTSMYPEDFRINSWGLIRQWTAEGFVQDREGMSREEIAKEYTHELVNRSLLQVEGREFDELIESCYMHDLVREIILSKAREHGIITMVKGRYRKGLNNARRLVIHDLTRDAQEDFHSKHLRSLVMFRYVDHMSTSSLLKLCCDRSKFLKVLNLGKSPLEHIPKEVFRLFHLKYLNLRGSQVKIIPKSIKSLQNLEFLDFAYTKVTKLPFEILKLRKLAVLYIYHYGDYSNNYEKSGFKAPDKIGGLVSLEHLETIEASKREIVREVGKLSQLRRLGITKLRREDGKELCCSLEKLTNLRHLTVASSTNEGGILDLQHNLSTIPQSLQSLILDGRLERVPPWVASLESLTHLYLYRSGPTEDQLECLQVLPSLLDLILDQAYEGERLFVKVEGFRKLKWLGLGQLKQLRDVTIDEGGMPHLQTLQLTDCESMKELPKGIQNLRELQSLWLNSMPKELITELENKIDQSHQRISHIPEVSIGNWVEGKWEWHYL